VGNDDCSRPALAVSRFRQTL